MHDYDVCVAEMSDNYKLLEIKNMRLKKRLAMHREKEAARGVRG